MQHIKINMSVEIEIKMKVDNHETVTGRLQEIGGTPVEVMLEQNIFMDREVKPLYKKGCGLRLRHEVPENGLPRWVVTYKGAKLPGEAKIRPEYETIVSDGETMKSIFEFLGYQQILLFEKKRSRWSFQNCTIELDELPHLGTYVEIEGPDETQVMQVREALGLQDHQLISKGYAALISNYADEHGIDRDLIRF